MSLVRGGALGTVRAVVSGFTFALEPAPNIRLDQTLGGGSLWDVGCYPVTYARLIVGPRPKMVFGTAHCHRGGVDEEFMGMLRFPGGTTARSRPDSAPRTGRGSRSWERRRIDGAQSVPAGCPRDPGAGAGRQIERIDVIGSPEIFVRQIEHFEASALDGTPPVVTLAESHRGPTPQAGLARFGAGFRGTDKISQIDGSGRFDGAVAALSGSRRRERPSVLTRLSCPAARLFTLAFFANDEMDRVENYDTMELAVFRADEIKRSLLADNWKEDASAR